MLFSIGAKMLNIFKNNKKAYNFTVPKGWKEQIKEKEVLMYNEKTNGEIGTSLYTITDLSVPTIDRITKMCDDMITQSNLELTTKIVVKNVDQNRYVLNCFCKDKENWFVAIWIIAEMPKVIIVTYTNKTKTDEFDIAQKFVDGIKFN